MESYDARHGISEYHPMPVRRSRIMELYRAETPWYLRVLHAVIRFLRAE